MTTEVSAAPPPPRPDPHRSSPTDPSTAPSPLANGMGPSQVPSSGSPPSHAHAHHAPPPHHHYPPGPPSYPPYHGYGGAPQSYGSPPPPGYSPPHHHHYPGGSASGYPPPPHHAPYGGGPPPYSSYRNTAGVGYYGYEAGSSPYPPAPKSNGVTPARNGGSPSKSPTSVPSSSLSRLPPPVSATPVDIDEARAAAAVTDVQLEDVRPIRTDFHFFVDAKKDEFLVKAKDEVRSKSVQEGEEKEPDAFLVNTLLNTLLMRAWEDMTTSEKEEYVLSEDTDRQRFMDEEEIISRHCATLTSRAKTPKEEGPPSGKKGTKDKRREPSASPTSVKSGAENTELEDDGEDGEGEDTSTTGSPPKKLKPETFEGV